MKTFRVLSIDAWSDGQNCPNCGSHNVMEQVSKPGMKCNSCLEIFDENEGVNWSWNNWFYQDEKYNESGYGPLNEKTAMQFFKDFFIQPGHDSEFEIEDDQYNLVLVRKSDRCPVLAIEYGNEG